MSLGPALIAPGELVDGRYEIVRLIGSGAMGQVYEARTRNGRACAIKTLLHLPTEADGRELMTRFLREARVTSKLSSPNVVHVEDAGYDENRHVPFIAMGLLKGCDLEQLVERVGPLRPELAVRIALQACEGLAQAHAVGVVHRDIKPSNLFLHEVRDGEIEVKVCDFGIAKVLGSDELLTKSGAILGTPLFMAPEQVRDSKHVDALADVWSLAMTLDFALSGEPALASRASLPDLMRAVMKADVSLVTDRARWIDPALADVLRSALRLKREDRCPSIDALRDRLLPFRGPAATIRAAELVGLPLEERTAPGPVSGDADTVSSGGMLAAPPSAQGDPLLGAMLSGRYRIERLLGRGGMGAVYQAVGADGTRVALKVLLGDAERHPNLARRFVRESRALTAIDSSYVVRVLDADTDAQRGLPFLVMELLRGDTLAATARAIGPLEPGPILRLFVQVCEGLDHAHRLGIIHRDVKPSNLMLHELPSGEVVLKLCDFGVAKRTHVSESDETTVELTHTGGVLGSPVYMSPEQARSAKTVDGRSDVWSLGMSLWEALTGHRPWEGCTSVGELIVAICTEDLRPLRELAPWLDPALVDAVERALRRDAGARYESARAFAEALAPHAAPAPTRLADLVAVRDTAPRAAFARSATGAAKTLSSAPARPQRGNMLPAGIAVAAAAIALGAWTMRPRGASAPPVVAVATTEPSAPAPATARSSEAPAPPAPIATQSAAPSAHVESAAPAIAARRDAPAPAPRSDAGARADVAPVKAAPAVPTFPPEAEKPATAAPAPVLTW